MLSLLIFIICLKLLLKKKPFPENASAGAAFSLVRPHEISPTLHIGFS